jgi:hypothetical protein
MERNRTSQAIIGACLGTDVRGDYAAPRLSRRRLVW